MTTTRQALDAEMKRQTEAMRLAAARNLAYAGERSVNAQRETRSYQDRTGNLRSSVGYVVVADGKVLGKDVSLGNAGTDRKTGMETASSLLDDLASSAAGTSLVVCAGMHYASYVAAKGYDVIDTAELTSREVLERLNATKI